MPPRKRTTTQHSTSRPKGELSTLERAEYYDKWRALRDDIEQTHGGMLPPLTQKEVHQEEVLNEMLRRMTEYEDGTR